MRCPRCQRRCAAAPHAAQNQTPARGGVGEAWCGVCVREASTGIKAAWDIHRWQRVCSGGTSWAGLGASGIKAARRLLPQLPLPPRTPYSASPHLEEEQVVAVGGGAALHLVVDLLACGRGGCCAPRGSVAHMRSERVPSMQVPGRQERATHRRRWRRRTPLRPPAPAPPTPPHQSDQGSERGSRRRPCLRGQGGGKRDGRHCGACSVQPGKVLSAALCKTLPVAQGWFSAIRSPPLAPATPPPTMQTRCLPGREGWGRFCSAPVAAKNTITAGGRGWEAEEREVVRAVRVAGAAPREGAVLSGVFGWNDCRPGGAKRVAVLGALGHYVWPVPMCLACCTGAAFVAVTSS